MKWGRRLLGRPKAPSYRKRNEGRFDNKRSNYYHYNKREREYEYSDDSYSQASYEEEDSYYEEDTGEWEDRDDEDADTREEYYDDYVEEGRYVDDEYRDDDGSESELVTRDQVLDELKAQAAAEALGKSLEQMGYNLDNCDSFYSLSDKEEEMDQRYKITQRNSEISASQKSASSGKTKKRHTKSKKKKKKSKSTRSRYSAASRSDDEDGASSTYYGNSGYSRARHHSFGDYETYGNSSSDASEDDSSYEDETLTYTTGRDSAALTGRTSRYSRYTGKKSARSRKSKSRKPKKRTRDNDTYYSRRTEWTRGDSSYGKTLDQSSTLSSVSSSSEDSDVDLNTEYTEPSRKREMARKKGASPRHAKTDKRKRNMKAIEEDKSYNNDDMSEESSSERKPKHEKKHSKTPHLLRRNSSRLSNSSQIGAMRSFDSFSDKINEVKGEENNKGNQKDSEAKKDSGGKDAKKQKPSKEPTPSPSEDNDENSGKKQKRTPKMSRSTKLDKIDSKEGVDEAEAEVKADAEEMASSDLSDAELGGKSSKRKLREDKKSPKDVASSKAHPERKSAKKGQEKEKSKRQPRSSDERHKKSSSDDEDAITTSDSDDERNEKPIDVKLRDEKQKKTDVSNREKATGRPRKDEEDEGGKRRKDAKKKARQLSPTRKGTATAKAKKDKSELAKGRKRFWRRQFLSLGGGKKKRRDKRRDDDEEEKKKESIEKNAVEGKDRGDDADHNVTEDGEKKRRKDDGAKRSLKATGKSTSPSSARTASRERSGSPERSVQRERSSSQDSRGRSPSPAPSEREVLPPKRENKERSKSADSKRKKASKESDSSKKDIHERRETVDADADNEPTPPQPDEGKKEQEKEPKPSSGSVGMFEIASMAAMIPLAPLAAAYNCYTAERTQSFITNGKACVDRSCKDAEAFKCAKPDSEHMKERDGDDHTRASSRKRRSKSKRKEGSNHQSDEEKSRSKTKKKDDTNNQSDEEKSSSKASAGAGSRTKPNAPTSKEQIEKDSAAPSTPEPKPPKEQKSPRLGSKSPKAKKALTKILPQLSSSRNDLSKTHIQEAPEGFESFLPGALDSQCLSLSDPVSPATHPFSPMMSTKEVSTSNAQEPQDGSNDKGARKKNKRWLPKLTFGAHKKHDGEENLNETPAAGQKDAQQAVQDQQGKPPARGPERLSFLHVGNKKASNENNISSTRALSSFWAETPTFASTRNKAGKKVKLENQKNLDSADGELVPFTCSKNSTVCGQVDDTEAEVFDNHSLLSDFENIALDALRKKSQKEAKHKGAGFDPSKATQEDLLKYYDLGQTLSDVIDARQTLEQAYGMHSGGASFDHTIDEQLVELLTHMAEMDQDDVVEIEAAIKKLKRHARKLGISERDLLFSVKSAEESALSLTGEDGGYVQENLEEPSSFSEKMIDAFEGYFGR